MKLKLGKETVRNLQSQDSNFQPLKTPQMANFQGGGRMVTHVVVVAFFLGRGSDQFLVEQHAMLPALIIVF